MFKKLNDYLTSRLDELQAWFVTVSDKRARKGRHAANYIHLFYVDPESYAVYKAPKAVYA